MIHWKKKDILVFDKAVQKEGPTPVLWRYTVYLRMVQTCPAGNAWAIKPYTIIRAYRMASFVKYGAHRKILELCHKNIEIVIGEKLSKLLLELYSGKCNWHRISVIFIWTILHVYLQSKYEMLCWYASKLYFVQKTSKTTPAHAVQYENTYRIYRHIKTAHYADQVHGMNIRNGVLIQHKYVVLQV